MSSECLKYNLTSNVAACYHQNPLMFIEDHWLSLAAIVVIITIIAYAAYRISRWEL